MSDFTYTKTTFKNEDCEISITLRSDVKLEDWVDAFNGVLKAMGYSGSVSEIQQSDDGHG